MLLISSQVYIVVIRLLDVFVFLGQEVVLAKVVLAIQMVIVVIAIIQIVLVGVVVLKMKFGTPISANALLFRLAFVRQV